MKTVVFIGIAFIGIVFSVNSYAQDYGQYLQSAKKMFKSGDYEAAEKALNIYRKMTHENTESEFAEKIDMCRTHLLTAKKAMAAQNYHAAMTAYKQIQNINSNDPNIKDYILECQQAINLSQNNQTNKLPIYAQKDNIYKNGSQLQEKEVRKLFANTSSYQPYNAGLNLYKTSRTLNGLGISTLCIGVILQCGWTANTDDSPDEKEIKRVDNWHNAAKIGIYLCGGSSIFFLASIPVRAAGRHKINKAVKLYNNQALDLSYQPELRVGVTTNGIGLIYTF